MDDQPIELMPLETLHADAAYLVGRAVNGTMEDANEVVAIIRSRIDAARDALAAQGQEVEPAFYVNKSVIDPQTGKLRGGFSDAITWSDEPAGDWLLPVYAGHPPRAQADAPAGPAAREQIIGSALYAAINEMMAQLGAAGQIDSRHPAVSAVMNALHDIDGGSPRAALAAQAQPPVIQPVADERATFEAWASDEGKFPHLLERVDGYYRFTSTQYYWAGWQARAALAQQVGAQADADSPMRAIEDAGLRRAEEKWIAGGMEAQADADRRDAEIAKHVSKLTTIMRMPNAEYVADEHNAAVEYLRGIFAAQKGGAA